MLLQARKALAIDRPELVVVQSIDHDITATRSATGPSIGLTAAPGRSTAAAPPLVPALEWS